MMFADLHLHTNFSDGTYTPEELAGRARELSLAAVALTDHDTVEGCARMAAACELAGLEFIPATELTAEVDGNELHLLGYFVDTQNPRLLAEMTRFQRVRQNRIREMVARLNRLVARALVMGGFCSSLDEAFERFLKKNRPAWVPKFKISAVDAIELIHQADGLAVIAHPGLNRADEIIPGLIRSGLDGVECFHTKHTATASAHYVRMAKELGLLITGGSDCHGLNKGKPLIGTIRLPYEYVEQLKAALARRESNASAPPSALRPSP